MGEKVDILRNACRGNKWKKRKAGIEVMASKENKKGDRKRPGLKQKERDIFKTMGFNMYWTYGKALST